MFEVKAKRFKINEKSCFFYEETVFYFLLLPFVYRPFRFIIKCKTQRYGEKFYFKKCLCFSTIRSKKIHASTIRFFRITINSNFNLYRFLNFTIPTKIS